MVSGLGVGGESAPRRDRFAVRSRRARALVLYVPLTTQSRLSSYEVPIPRLPFLDRDSVANVQGFGSIPTVRLERRLGKIPNDVLTKLRIALAFALDLEASR